jgi:hypothetical protein
VEGNVLGVIGYLLALIKEMSDVIYLPDPSFPPPRDLLGEVFSDSFPIAGRNTLLENDIMLYRHVYELWRKKLGNTILPPVVERKFADWKFADFYIYDERISTEPDPSEQRRIKWALGLLQDHLPHEKLPLADYLVHSCIVQDAKSIVHGRRVAVFDNGLKALGWRDGRGCFMLHQV